jgi:hypothetical protein
VKPKLIKIIYLIKSVSAFKKIQIFSTAEISWLMLFREIIAVHPENHMILSGSNAGLLIVTADEA